MSNRGTLGNAALAFVLALTTAVAAKQPTPSDPFAALAAMPASPPVCCGWKTSAGKPASSSTIHAAWPWRGSRSRGW
jgi:hypothetical protein